MSARRIILPAAMVLVAAACGGPADDAAAPSAQAPREEIAMDIAPGLEDYVEQAVSDLAERLDIDRDEIELADAEFVTWSDGSLGCPEPGHMYTQALVPGYRIRLHVGKEIHAYHGARDRDPFYCPADRARPPAATGEAIR